MTSEDRRVFKRIAFDASTSIHQAGNSWPVTLLDLSLKGLLVEPPQNWQLDLLQPAAVDIRLSDDTRITMTVRWRHSEHGQFGFECLHIDIESISHLRRLVELNLGDSQLLERELNMLGNNGS